jgi:hypothetical protein
MQLIHVDVDTMRNATTSANFNSIMQSFETLMGEGYVMQIIQEYTNAPTDKLFQINDYDQFEKWVENGCSSTL